MATEENQLKLFGSEYIPPVRLASPIDLRSGDADRYLDESEKQYRDTVNKQKEDLWGEFASTYKAEFAIPKSYKEFKKLWKVPEDPGTGKKHDYRAFRSGLPANVENRNAYFNTHIGRYQQDYAKLWKNYKEFYIKKQVERVSKLRETNPDLYELELEMGGFDLDPTNSKRSPIVNSFLNGLVDSVSFGSVNYDYLNTGDRTSGIYGDDINSHWWKSRGLGSLIGDLTTLYFSASAMGKAANSIGKVTKIANAIKKAGKINSLLRLTGAPGAAMRKGLLSWRTLKIASKGSPAALSELTGLALSQGTAQAMSGLVFGFKNFLSQAVRNRVSEDNLTDEEWKALTEGGNNELIERIKREGKLAKDSIFQNNTASSAVTGFLMGFGISLINAPSAWKARFVLDGAWSTANQGLNVMTGQQDGWNNQQFLYDMLLGHAIGERGLMFKKLGKSWLTPIKDPLAIEFKNRTEEMLSITKRAIPAQNADIQNEIAGLTALTELASGQKMTGELAKSHIKHYDMRFNAVKDQYMSSIYKEFVDIPDTRARVFERTEAYKRYFTQVMDIDPKLLADAQSPEGVLAALKSQPKLVLKPTYPGITSTELVNGIDASLKLHANDPKWADNAVNKSLKKIASLPEFTRGGDELSKENFYNPDPTLYEKGTRRIKPDVIDTHKRGAVNDLRSAVKLNIDNYYRGTDSITGNKTKDSFLALFNGVRKNDKFLSGVWKNLDKPDREFAFEEIKSLSGRKALELKDTDYEKMIDTYEDRPTQIKKSMSSAVSKATWEILRTYEQKEDNLSLDKEIAPGLAFGDKVAAPTTDEGVAKSSLDSMSGAQKELLDLIDLEKGYENRKTKEYKRDRSGVNPKDYNNQHYTILREMTKSHPGNTIDALIRYWKSSKGIDNYQIQSHLAKYGIIMTTDNISGRNRNTYVNSPKWQAAENKLQNPESIEEIMQRADETIGRINETTGIDSEINSHTFRAGVANIGGYVMSDADFVSKMRTRYGDNVANHCHKAFANYLERRVDSFNKDFNTKVNLSEVILRNPEHNNGNDFIITAKNVDRRQLFNFTTDVFNVLTKQYANNVQNDDRAFALLLDKNIRVHNAEGTTIAFTRDYESLDRVSTASKYVKDLIDKIYPGSTKKVSHMMLNFDNPNVKAALINVMNSAKQQITGVGTVDRIAELGKIVDESVSIQNSHNEFVQGQNYAEDSKVLGDTPRNVAAKRNLVEQGPDDNMLKREFMERMDDDYTGASDAQLKEMESRTTMFDENRKKRAVKEDHDTFGRVKEVIKHPIQAYEESKLGNFLKKKMSNLEGKDELEQYSRDVKNLLGDKEFASTITATDVVTSMMGADYHNKYFKGNDNSVRRDVHDRIWMFGYENGIGEVFENKIKMDAPQVERTGPKEVKFIRENLKENWKEMLEKPITNDEDTIGIVDSWKEGPNKNLTGASLIEMDQKSKDPLKFPKILVQHFGIKPDDLVDFYIRVQDTFDTVAQLHESTGGFEGSYRILDVYKRLSEKKSDEIDKYLAENAHKFGETEERRDPFGDLSDESVGIDKPPTSIENIMSKFSDDKKGVDAVMKQVNDIINYDKAMYKAANPGATDTDYDASSSASKGNRISLSVLELASIDPARMKYTSHRILADADNKKLLGSEINKFNELAGRSPSGEELMDTSLRDVHGRAFTTAMDALRAGYSLELNGTRVMHSVVRYAYDKSATWELANKWKTDSIDQLTAAMEPIQQAIKESRAFLKETKGIPSEKRLPVLIKRAEDIFMMKDEFLAKIRDHNGVWYTYNRQDEINVSGKIKRIKERIEEVDAESSEYTKLNNELVKQKGKLKAIEDIYSYEQAYPFTRAYQDIMEIEGLEEVKGKNKGILESRLKTKREEVRAGIRAARHLQGAATEKFMPLNAANHNRDAADKDKSHGRSYIYNPAFTPTVIKEDGLKSPSIPGFEGLYVDRALMKEMNTLMFKNDPSDLNDRHEFTKGFLKNFDKANHVFKGMTFWKFTIMAANDLGQSGIGHNVVSAKFGRDVIFAIRAKTGSKSAPNTSIKEFNANTPEQFYWLVNRENLFHKSSGVRPLMTDSLKMMASLAGNEWKAIVKQMFGGDEMAAKSAITKGITGAFRGFRYFQEAAWWVDESFRLASSKQWYDRFFRFHAGKENVSKKSIKLYKTGNKENIAKIPREELGRIKNAQDIAIKLAVEKTNNNLANYSELPYQSKIFLNRLFFVPNYRIQEAKIYGRLVGDFKRGLDVVKNGIDKTDKFQTSEGVVGEAIRLMGPMIRKVMLSSIIKYSMFSLFGFGTDGVWDTLTGYRLSKVVNQDDPLNSYIRYLSLSTPVFTMEKYLTRNWKLFLRYNQSALIGLGTSLLFNKDRIRGSKIFNLSDNAITATAKMGLYTLQNFFPMGFEIADLSKSDLSVMEKVINVSGLGYVYKTDSPNEILKDFYTIVNKSNTIGERKRALNNFQRGLNRASNMLMKENYADIYDRMLIDRKKILESEI